MPDTFKISLTLPLLALLAACQTTPRTATIDKAVCSIWTTATYSASQDSQTTIDGNRALNARRDAYCGKK